MMKRLLFLLLLLVSAVVLFSCASDAEEPVEDEIPVVDAVAETPVTEEVHDVPLVVVEPEIEAEIEAEEPVADELPVTEEVQPEEETIPLQVEFEGDEDEFVPVEDEFVPVEEREYTLDVTSYYDDFIISEDDFIVVEVPEPVPEPEPEPEPEPASVLDVPFTVEEPVPAVTVASPAMEPLFVPSPREDMKKPVEIISEEQAVAASELSDEGELSAVEEILASLPEAEEPQKPVPSRTVTIHKNDIIEVPYQGNWWVYLGDVNGSNALVFSGRDYISEKTVFTLRAVKEGSALLHFFKQDIIANVLVDDYLEVTVAENGADSEHITLDMFVISQIKNVPVSADESGIESEDEGFAEADDTAETETIVTGQKTAVPAVREPEPQYVPGEGKTGTSPVQSFDIMDEGDVVSAVEEEVTDEYLYLKAQELEATDIEGALELYRKLVAEFPVSPYWTKANNRIIYINRFYFFKR